MPAQNRYSKRKIPGTLAALLSTFFLAACNNGSASSSAASGSSGNNPSALNPASGARVVQFGSNPVVLIRASRSAQVLKASPKTGSKSDEATFSLSAVNQAGSLVAGAPVTFYVGPMVALSGHPPTAWLSSSSPAAAKYIASSSSTTSSTGQASITLFGQPNGTMEMIGVKIGQVSSFSHSKATALGSLDAWWTNSAKSDSAPIGDYLTATVLAAKVPGSKNAALVISAYGPAGPIQGAKVSVTNKTAPAPTSSMGSSSMGSSTAKSPQTTVLITAKNGSVTYPVAFSNPASTQANTPPIAVLRIVVTQANGKRAAGAIALELSR